MDVIPCGCNSTSTIQFYGTINWYIIHFFQNVLHIRENVRLYNIL